MPFKGIAAICALIFFIGILAVPARATLLTVGTATYGGNNYNLIYDNSSPFGSIVYLDYTHVYTGLNNWATQVAWANSLNAAVITYNFLPGYSMNWNSGWRLPNSIDGPRITSYDGSTAYGYNLTSSELGHLYYTELGNLGYYNASGVFQPGYGLTHTGPFNNLQSSYYWSGTNYSDAPNYAYAFGTDVGYQGGGNGYYGVCLAMAVRPGELQLDSEPVPEPSTILLLGAGLGGLVLQKRKSRKGYDFKSDRSKC